MFTSGDVLFPEIFEITLGSEKGKYLVPQQGVVSGLSPSFSTRGVGDPGKGSRTTSWSKGLPHRSDVLVLSQKLSPGADARRRLGRQGELELFEQQFVISLRASEAA
jgi:hypothetical protein